ncbi:MAG TPA: glycosyltransferase [Cyclobacteriaceae bacterium]|nr:glycosyltransferase [Cyclobacteriaceae bacterium]
MLFILSLFAWSILGIQIVYLFILLLAFIRKREIQSAGTPAVSIVVCAHDEEQNLRELIPLLLQQEYPEMEIIVVEDRCNDGTYDFLLEATQLDQRLKMVRVRHLPEHINGKKYALTLGIKAAAYDWILLTDADCRPEGNQWVKTMTSQFSDTHDIVIGYSPFVRTNGYLNSFIRFESLLTGIQFIGWALLSRPYMGVGRNLAYRKKLFIDNKGFNNFLSLTGGDDDLFVNQHASKTNTAVSIAKGSLMWSLPKQTWREFLVQKLRHLSAGKKYHFSDKLLLGLFSTTWIMSWIIVVPVMIILPPMQSFVWIGFIVRELLLVGLVYRASKTLGDPFEGWKTPFLDFNYAIYYLGTGLVALISKRVRWKI